MLRRGSPWLRVASALASPNVPLGGAAWRAVGVQPCGCLPTRVLGSPDKFSSEIISLLSDFRRLLLCCDSQFSYYRLWSAYRA